MIRGATIIIALASAAPVGAACPDFDHPKLAAGPGIDLGDGLVAQSQARFGRVTGREDLFGEAIFLLHDCSAGDSLWLYAQREEPRGSMIYNREAEILALLDEIPAASELDNLSAVAAVAETRGVDTMEIGVIGIETCLCAEIYPGLQGEKIPYEDVK